MTSFSQKNDKKVYYYVDDIYKTISETQFLNNRRDLIERTKIENDTAILHELTYRKTYNRLSNDEKKEFYRLLEQTVDTKIDTTHTIIINFFFKKHSCIKQYTSQKQYLESIKKTKNLSQFFITEKTYRYRKAYKDKFDFIRRFFFNFEVSCGNYLIVKPDGAYYKQYGEYHQEEIVDLALRDWSTIFVKD